MNYENDMQTKYGPVSDATAADICVSFEYLERLKKTPSDVDINSYIHEKIPDKIFAILDHYDCFDIEWGGEPGGDGGVNPYPKSAVAADQKHLVLIESELNNLLLDKIRLSLPYIWRCKKEKCNHFLQELTTRNQIVQKLGDFSKGQYQKCPKCRRLNKFSFFANGKIRFILLT